jgi:hypothetical protein
MRAQDRRDQRAVTATDVHHGVEPGEVVGGRQLRGGQPGALAHRRVEQRRQLGAGVQVGEEVGAELVVEHPLAGAHALLEPQPWPHQCRVGEHPGERVHRVRPVGA